MSIQKTRKDHLSDHAMVELAATSTEAVDKADVTHDAKNAQNAMAATVAAVEKEDFKVKAQSGKIFDFSDLANGKAGGRRKGNTAYTGRPELATELMPAIRDLAFCEAELTVVARRNALRFFWRTLDEIEFRAPDAPRLKSMIEISSMHRQAVIDRGMKQQMFSSLIKPFNLTLKALGHKRLNWPGPLSGGNKVKHLPSQEEIKRIKDALKRIWFGWRDKYELAQKLLSLPEQDAQKLTQDQRFILQNLLRFKNAQQENGVALPSRTQLNLEGLVAESGKPMQYHELCSYFFPNSLAIRSAFHLCLAASGWNVSVLLHLQVDQEIFQTHPTDENRYIMIGVKRRAGHAEQRCDGLKKSQQGPYSIINFLIEVTKPLREQLKKRGEDIKAKLATPAAFGLDKKAYTALGQELLGIEDAQRSFWLNFTAATTGKSSGFGGILRLTDQNYSDVSGGSLVNKIIDGLNKNNPEQPIGMMTASDFRDAYAIHWYEFTGGDILTVMRMLNHRRIGTTVSYTNNVVVRVRNQAKARKVLQAWWGEVEEHGQADPTLVSFTVQHGKPSSEQRERLKTYRSFMLTQLGTRCSDPHNPPSHVAPHFEPDGKKVCHVQRCMLCVTHAVITQESLDGIARRLAELTHIQSTMSVAAWEAAAYDEERENTELALAGFEATAAREAVGLWTRRIESGEHQVMPFESS